MVLLESLKINLGTPAPFFSLPATDGRRYSLSDFSGVSGVSGASGISGASGAKILIVVFMCNHCPYVRAVLDRLIAIQKDYGDLGVRIVGINSNDSSLYPDDSFENMKVLVAEKGVNFVYLYDESQEVARAYNAQCTPDIFVYDEKRLLVYHGRIDDNWKELSLVMRNELREALDALLAGKSPSSDQKPSMGCSIKWK